MENRRQINHHILNASSNLLGISFLVISSLRAFRVSDTTLLDETTSVSALMFMVSTILSYLSIRSTTNMALHLERIADYIFILGILSLTASAVFLTVHVVD